MRGGTAGWGTYGSITEHALYVEKITAPGGRRKCHCGCKRRATHKLFANGICMGQGCELSMRRMAKVGRKPSSGTLGKVGDAR